MDRFGLGVWSHNIKDFGSKAELKERVKQLADTGFDLVVPCVKNPPGAVDFFTDVANVNPDYPNWDPLRVLIETASERGMKVHPWFCVFPEGDGSKLLHEHPECRAKIEGRMRWACACRPEVQDYVFELYKSLAHNYRPAGLHLDYIRTGGRCVCDFCKAQMRERGIDIEAVDQGTPEFEQWTRWRAGRITDCVRRVHELTQAEGIELSAAAFSGYPDCIESQGQDWVQWAEEGVVDFLFPMTYTQSLRVATMRTVAHLAQVAGKVPVWEGLCKRASRFARCSPEELVEQIGAVLEKGAQGVMIFSYSSLEPGDFEAIGQLRSG